MYKCEYCEQELTSKDEVRVAHGTLVHERCYDHMFPWEDKMTFYEMLVDEQDPILIRQLLETYIPMKIQKSILEKYNEIMREQSKRKMAA